MANARAANKAGVKGNDNVGGPPDIVLRLSGRGSRFAIQAGGVHTCADSELVGNGRLRFRDLIPSQQTSDRNRPEVVVFVDIDNGLRFPCGFLQKLGAGCDETRHRVETPQTIAVAHFLAKHGEIAASQDSLENRRNSFSIGFQVGGSLAAKVLQDLKV